MDEELKKKLQAKRPPQSTTSKIEVVDNSSKEGTKKGETRATFIVNEEVLSKVKAIASSSSRMIKEVIGEALEDIVVKYQ